ncbi:hypothetical protein Tco_0227597 [Tanacetum coccineum]
MAEQQTIKYAPQWTNVTVDNVIFQTNNVVGNINYPPNVPAYKPIMKFLQNCPLYNAFINCPLVVYQNFLREFWSTSVAFDPFPSTDEPEKRPLKEFLIKFLVLNRQRHLTLDFDTFCSSTDLNYNNDKYVDHPTPEVVKKELGKIAINPSYLDKTLVLKNSFPMAWRILFTFVIQVLGGNYSSTKQVNSIQQLLAYSLITGTEVDIWEIIYSDLVTKLLNKSRLKYVSYPRFISCALQVLLDPSKVTDIVLTAHIIVVNNQRDSVSLHPLVAKPKKGKSQTVASILPKSQGPEASGALSKKNKRPKSKNPPTETKVTPPKLMEGGNKQPLARDIPFTTPDEGTAKTTPRPEGSLGDKDSGENIPSADIEPIHTPIADPSGTGAKYQVDETQSTRLRYWSLTKNEGKTSFEVKLGKDNDEEEVLAAQVDMDEDIQAAEEVRTPSPKQDQPEPSQEHHEEAVVSYADLKASIEQYYDENIAHRDQAGKLMEASMSSLDRNNPTANQKINEATETFATISSNITEVISLVKSFDFFALLSTVKDLQAYALKQEEASTTWIKSSTNMAWNLGSRMIAVEIS